MPIVIRSKLQQPAHSHSTPSNLTFQEGFVAAHGRCSVRITLELPHWAHLTQPIPQLHPWYPQQLLPSAHPEAASSAAAAATCVALNGALFPERHLRQRSYAKPLMCPISVDSSPVPCLDDLLLQARRQLAPDLTVMCSTRRQLY
jgi:hypothetical protein